MKSYHGQESSGSEKKDVVSGRGRIMLRQWGRLIGIAWGTVGLVCGVAWANTPSGLVRTTIEQATVILKDSSLQNQERLDKLEALLLPHVDAKEFARRCLARHWRDLDEAQQQEFTDLFIELIKKTYGGMLNRYPGEVRITFEQERVEDNYAEVATRVFAPIREEPFDVRYRMHQTSERWLIYDVVLENVSMVRNYRNQFNRILNKHSFADLIVRLKQKIQEIEANPSVS